jgi:TonB family protein
LKVGDLVDINEPGVTPPRCEACPKPRTPLIAEHSPVAQRLRGKGYLVLLVLVDENGRVVEVKPQRQVEFLSDAATKAVRKWRFHPAAKNGVAVKVWIGVGVHFELAGEPTPTDSEPLPFPPP